jgi:putative phosphoribosyl transferase
MDQMRRVTVLNLHCTNVATMNTQSRFANRRHAGLLLAQSLRNFAGRSDVTVLALPRGGVPVAKPVADALHAPLDVFVVRKLGAPGHEELALGAIAEGGAEVRHTDLIKALGVSQAAFDEVAARERRELEHRVLAYRQGAPTAPLNGRIVILVDDGLATGATMEAAIAGVRQHQPEEIVVAVPVGSPDTCRRIATIADTVVCLLSPPDFGAVGEWYDDFSQTSNNEVTALLRSHTGE